jgi:hypothetical protein
MKDTFISTRASCEARKFAPSENAKFPHGSANSRYQKHANNPNRHGRELVKEPKISLPAKKKQKSITKRTSRKACMPLLLSVNRLLSLS